MASYCQSNLMQKISSFKDNILLILASFSLISSSFVQASEEVNVYSYRQAFLVEPLFDKFTEKTGIKVNVFFC
jgi:iron(III) transport system substrate-binding protein